MTIYEVCRKNYLFRVSIVLAVRQAKAGNCEEYHKRLAEFWAMCEMCNSLQDELIPIDVWFRAMELCGKIYVCSV